MRGLALLLFAACATPAIDGTWVPAEDAPLAVEIDRARAADEPGARIRVVTYNVHFGEDVDALAAALDGAGDVLLLQEIESYPDEGSSRAARLADRLAMNHVYAPARTEGDGAHGLAILTPLAIEEVEVMQLPDIEHAWNDRTRIALAATVGGLRVVDVHLDTRANLTDRVRQLHPAVAAEGDRVVVAGDFNTDPYVWIAGGVPLASLAALNDLDQAAALDDYMEAMEFDTPTAGAGDTFAAGPLSLRLDAIYSRGLATGDAGVLDVDASDHRPLWLDVDL
jgi:endonuclease/exonuclease/phosphatase family metal-dependent hydrolase